MGKRDHYTSEQRAREREANRQRMSRKRQDPEYRAQTNARRRARDAERKKADPRLRKRLTANSKNYYEGRKNDPEFRAKRQAYLNRWRSERRLGEEFEAFMARITTEAAE